MENTILGTPQVTIGVICFNTGNYVVEAIESLLNQTYKNFEVIIIDDNSTDGNSVQIIDDYLKREKLNFKFIKKDKNQGLAKNFIEISNLASLNSKYFSCIGDDIWHPDFLYENIMALENSDNSVIAAFSDSLVVDYKTKKTIREDVFFSKKNTNKLYEKILVNKQGNYYHLKSEILFDALLVANFINAISVVFKIEQYSIAGKHDVDYNVEDYPTWVKWAKNGYDFIYIPKTLSTYNIHGANYSVRYSSKVYDAGLKVQMKYFKYSTSSEVLVSVYFKLLGESKSFIQKFNSFFRIVKLKPKAFFIIPVAIAIRKFNF